MSVAALLVAASVSVATQVPVSMSVSAFLPDTVRISAGDSVVWTNNAVAAHTTTSGVSGTPNGLWDSGSMEHGATFTHEFPTTGTFPYYCQFFYPMGMVGAVIVQTGGVSEKPGIPGNISDMTSSPNPFRGATTIRLTPAGASRGSVGVFDASGRLVRTLVPVRGTSVVWDGKDNQGQVTAPGVYFCRCGSGALAVTRLR